MEQHCPLHLRRFFFFAWSAKDPRIIRYAVVLYYYLRVARGGHQRRKFAPLPTQQPAHVANPAGGCRKQSNGAPHMPCFRRAIYAWFRPLLSAAIPPHTRCPRPIGSKRFQLKGRWTGERGEPYPPKPRADRGRPSLRTAMAAQARQCVCVLVCFACESKQAE